MYAHTRQVEKIVSVPVTILQSEVESGILHKVWIGPFDTDEENERISNLVINANLGSPIKVDVE